MIRTLRNFSSKKLRTAYLLLGCLLPGLANATYTPVAISSGYNADVVANGTGTAASLSTAAFDAVTGGYNLMTLGYNNGTVSSTTGLPTTGLINSFSNPGLTYQMAHFDSSNSLRIDASATPGTLTFATPTAAGELYLLISSGGGAGTVDVTVNFSNSTTQTFTSQSISDWYNGSGYAINGLGRVDRTTNSISNDASNPRLYDLKLVISPANWALTIASVTVTRTSASGIINVMGVSLNDVCSGAPNAGTTVMTPSVTCFSTPFTVSTTGASTSVGRTYQWYSSPASMNTWTAISGATNTSYTEAAGVLAATDYRRMDSCTVSGLTANSTTLTVTPSAGLPGGTYTIDPSLPASATNFQSFTTAVDAMKCGILGNVIVNVAPGNTFTEQVTLPASINASASQTVTFNGNGDTLKWAGTSTQPWTLGLNGADYITFNNLVVRGTDATYALVAHLWNNADYNSFKNCTFMTNPNVTSGTTVAFSVTGSATSGSTTGAANGSYNTVDSCTMFGGYYGATFYGNTAALQANGNRLLNSTIRDFYFYGNYNSNQDSVEVTNNIIERPTRTTLSSFYGIYIASGCSNALIQKNRARNQFGGNPTYAGASYNIYVNSTSATVGNENKVINNLISNFNGNSSAYGIYMPSATNVQVYNNTVSVDNTSATTGTVYGLYSTGTTNVDVKNNNISVTQGGTGTKYCIYFSSVSGKTSNYNNLYMGSTTGTNNIGYASGAQATFANWQAVNSNAFDQNGSNQNPMFASPATGNFAPTNAAMDNLATPLAAVVDDITGAPRNAVTPDMGAYEFSVPVCSGTPNAGTAFAAANVCSSVSFTVNDTGFTIASGMTYQWQDSSSISGAWADIINATNASYTASAGITVATSYRVVMTCTNSFLSDTSNQVNIGLNSFLNCYCASAATSTIDEDIFNVTIGSLNNTSNCTTPASGIGSVLSLYSNYTNMPPTTILQDQPYQLSVSVGTCGTYNYTGWVKAWIDLNRDGQFTSSNPNEEVLSSAYNSLPTGTYSQSVTIPSVTFPDTGITRMRVIAVESGSATSVTPCLSYGYGETEDYYINIAAAVSCIGKPNAGVAYGSTAVCQSKSFTVNDSAYTAASGITFQWQDSSNVSGAWADILNATNASYTASAGITVPTAYRMIITCTNSFLSDTSNQVNIGLSSFLNCYCTSSAQYSGDEDILNVTFGSLNNTSTCATTAPGPGSVNQMYSNYTTSVAAPTVMQGSLVPFSVQNGTCGGYYGTYTKIFIDYNQNGVFEPLLGEEVYASTYQSSAGTLSGNITIPITADTGLTRMRVITQESSTPVSCGTYGWGETEDYLINVAAAVVCTGTPSAGVAYGPTAVCPSQSFTVNDSASTVGMGITYQWQDSSINNTWTDILIATNTSYTASAGIAVSTAYRMIVTCTNSSSMDTSNSIFLGLNLPVNCYCIPGTTNSGASDDILNVTFGGINHSTTYVSNPGVSGYNDFTSVVLPAQVAKGNVDTFKMTINSGGTEYGAIWIDWDQNGMFDTSEFTYIGSGATPTVISQPISIPLTATVGTTRMRVRSKWGSLLANTDPCSAYTYGETEDYLVQVGYPLAITLKDISAINQGSKNRVDWSSEAELKGDVYELERSIDGTHFETIYTTPAKGTASRYSYVDNNAFAGVNYYRLNMKQANGSHGYSKVVTATVGGAAFAVHAFPNPVANELTVKVNGMMAADATVQLTDLTGKVITMVQLSGATTTIDMKGLANGVYLVKYMDANHTQTIRVTKQ